GVSGCAGRVFACECVSDVGCDLRDRLEFAACDDVREEWRDCVDPSGCGCVVAMGMADDRAGSDECERMLVGVREERVALNDEDCFSGGIAWCAGVGG